MYSSATAMVAGAQCVLVADDNPVHRRRVCHLLGRRGYRVRAVGDGHAAVAACTAHAYDVVLMDLRLPVMGGIEAAQSIRAREWAVGRRTPIVALAVHATADERARCRAAGIDDCLAKPVTAAELFAAIEGATAIAAYAGTRERAGSRDAHEAARA